MENKKIASVFGEVWCLLVGIFGIVVAAAGYISEVMLMIGSSQIPFFGGFFIAKSIIGMLLYETPILLIGIGGILLYTKGKKEILNTTGIGMIKVSVMIRGISAFVSGVIISIFGLITTFGMFFTMSFAMSLLNDLVGEDVLSIVGVGLGGGLISLLITAVCIFMTVMFLIFTLGLNKVLGKTVEAYKTGKYEYNKSVTFGGVVVIVHIVSMFILTLLSLIANLMISDLASSLSGIQTTSVISSILAFVSEIGMFVLVLMAIMFANRMRKMSEKSEENGPDIIIDDGQDGDEQRTVPLTPPKYVGGGKITSLSGMDKGATYTIKDGEEIIIGKDPNTANIIIDKKYEKISRRHCGIKYDAENDIYMVIDYSMNGTYINSVKQLSKNIYVKVPKGTIINLAKENIDYKLC